jgi:hypothetical protein
MTEKVKQHWAAEERRRKKKKKKKKNSPPLHKSIEWGQKPLGTKNAAEKKKKKKKTEQTQLHKYMMMLVQNTDARDINNETRPCCGDNSSYQRQR